MAQFTFTFTVPDEEMSRVDAALRKYFGPILEEVAPASEGDKATYVSRERTVPELQAAIRDFVAQRVRDIIVKVEATEAAENAAKSVHDTVVSVQMNT